MESSNQKRTHQKNDSLLQVACKKGFLTYNPLEDIDIPKLEKRKKRKHLTKEEAEDVLRYVRNAKFIYKFEKARAYAMIAIFIFTRLRIGELFNLEMRDVDLENKNISVCEGKGNKDHNIPIADRFILVLQDYLKHRARLKKESSYFFFGMKFGRKL